MSFWMNLFPYQIYFLMLTYLYWIKFSIILLLFFNSDIDFVEMSDYY